MYHKHREGVIQIFKYFGNRTHAKLKLAFPIQIRPSSFVHITFSLKYIFHPFLFKLGMYDHWTNTLSYLYPDEKFDPWALKGELGQISKCY